MLTVFTTSFMFFIFSIMLPGFKVKGSKLNYVWLSAGYLLLMWIVDIVIVPIEMVTGFIFGIIRIIPLIGPIIANFSNASVAFALTLGSTFVLLIILDALMESFKMDSKIVAFSVSLVLALFKAIPIALGF